MSESATDTAANVDDDDTDPETFVRYEIVDELQYTAADTHRPYGEQEYLAPVDDDTKFDMLEGADLIEVLDWKYKPSVEETYSGPPEVILSENSEKLGLAIPSTHGDTINTVELGSFKCERCKTVNKVPVTYGDDVEHPYECESCEREGPFTHIGLEDTNMSVDALANPMWKPPAGYTDEGYSSLWDDVKDYLHTHWATREPYMYEGLTAFAMSTWVRDNFDFLPHMMVMGKHETGKTRLLNTLANVSYRAVVPVSTTPAAMYRTIDDYDTSFFISEYHDLDYEIQNEVNAVIKGAQKRNEIVLRAEPTNDGYNPVAFRQFTHVAIGTQFSPPDDIISRCVLVKTHPADRDIPMKLADATDLRSRLLYARYRLLNSDEWKTAEYAAKDYLDDRGIKGRLREKLLCLVTIAELWDRVDAIEPFVDVMQHEAEKASADSEDADAIRALMEVAFDELTTQNQLDENANPWNAVQPLQRKVVQVFEDMTGREISSRKFTEIRKRLDLESSKGRDGVIIDDDELDVKLRRLADENNIPWQSAPVTKEIHEIPDTEREDGLCSLCGRDTVLSYHNVAEGHYMCNRCGTEATN